MVGRISIAALSLGERQKEPIALPLAYSKERKQFGKSISSFQGISFKLLKWPQKLKLQLLLTQKAAEMKNQKLNVTQQELWQNFCF